MTDPTITITTAPDPRPEPGPMPTLYVVVSRSFNRSENQWKATASGHIDMDTAKATAAWCSLSGARDVQIVKIEFGMAAEKPSPDTAEMRAAIDDRDRIICALVAEREAVRQKQPLLFPYNQNRGRELRKATDERVAATAAVSALDLTPWGGGK